MIIMNATTAIQPLAKSICKRNSYKLNAKLPVSKTLVCMCVGK